MLLPELSRNNTHGLGPTHCFFRGLYRRVMDRNRKKVFAVGFHKTGTTSLARALQVLGYRVCGFVTPDSVVHPSSHTRKELFESTYRPLLNEYDAFEDTLWFMFYRELADIYPDAKFILTVRPEEKWYRSMVKHFGGYDRKYFHWLYEGKGDPDGNRDLFIEKYTRHNREVREYFRNKEQDLLVMRLPEDFNWDVLCDYMNCPKPYGSFPHANTASSRGTLKRKLIYQVKGWYYRW